MFSTGEGRGRLLAAVGATVALLALPGVASAQDMTMCESRSPAPGDPLPYAFQITASIVHLDISVLDSAALAGARSQYTAFWGNDRRHGWGVAIGPGPLSADAVKDAIVAQLPANLNEAQRWLAIERLSVWQRPFNRSDLQLAQDQVIAALSPLDEGFGLDVREECVPGDPAAGTVDAVRIKATLYRGETDPSPEFRADAEARVAGLGDVVRVDVKRGNNHMSVWPDPPPGWMPYTPPPVPAPQPPALDVARYVSLPKASRCVRGDTITVKARKRSDLKRLTVKSPNKTVSLRGGKNARIRLAAGRKTTLAVTVTSTTGQTASKTFTFKRC